MTTRIEKTVFISYRRTNLPWALCIYQNLTMHGYDVFFDYQSINSGDFEKVILENIKVRAHFIVVLTPSALERCKEPNDWLRREIETAIDEKRNIVPIMLESFDFGSQPTAKALTGNLSALKNFNGLRVPSEYFLEAMDRLRDRYLSVTLDNLVLSTLNAEARDITNSHKIAANNAPPVKKEELTAQEWFEKGYLFGEAKDFDESIRCYTEAIHLQPNAAIAYNNRGVSYRDKDDLDSAIRDYDEAIRIKPDYVEVYNNRGVARGGKGDHDGAIADYTEALRIKPDLTSAYYGRGITRQTKGEISGAIEDYKATLQLNPDYGLARMSLFGLLQKSGRNIEAKEHEQLARKLIQKEKEYNQACFEAICGNTARALALLQIGLEQGQAPKEWARQDPDLENLRNDPRFKELVGE